MAAAFSFVSTPPINPNKPEYHLILLKSLEDDMTSMATGGAAQEIDFVTLGMFIIGMLFALSGLLPYCPSAVVVVGLGCATSLPSCRAVQLQLQFDVD